MDKGWMAIPSPGSIWRPKVWGENPSTVMVTNVTIHPDGVGDDLVWFDISGPRDQSKGLLRDWNEHFTFVRDGRPYARCANCGEDLLFSARQRGDSLCGPCCRAAGIDWLKATGHPKGYWICLWTQAEWQGTWLAQLVSQMPKKDQAAYEQRVRDNKRAIVLNMIAEVEATMAGIKTRTQEKVTA